jgi:hypothetical protein
VTNSNKQRGRPSLDKSERIKRQAARDYRALKLTRALTEEDIYANRMGDTKRGRKPLSLKEQVSRAKKAFLISLDKYFIEFDEQKTNLSSIKELLHFFLRYRASDEAGRDAADDVIKLKQYISKKKRDQTDLDNKEEPVYSGRGPRPASNDDLWIRYQQEIDAAMSEIHSLLKNKSLSEQLKYEIHDLKVDRRRLNVKKNKNEIEESEYTRLKRDLDHEIDQLEVKKIQYEFQEADEIALQEMDIMPNSSQSKSNLPQSMANLSQHVPFSNVNLNIQELQIDKEILQKIKNQKVHKNQNRELLIEIENYLSNLSNLINLKEQKLLIEKEMIELKIILNT